MSDPAERFRTRLSEQLRAAFADRDSAAIRTLRCVMAALDNAGAVSLEEASRAAPSTTETPRRRLSEREIAEILQAEIAARSKAAAEYTRLGNGAQAAKLHDEIATIQHLTTLQMLSESPP
jgi:hypothetical protein